MMQLLIFNQIISLIYLIKIFNGLTVLVFPGLSQTYAHTPCRQTGTPRSPRRSRPVEILHSCLLSSPSPDKHQSRTDPLCLQHPPDSPSSAAETDH